MRISPLPAFVARRGPGGLTASLAATLPHDAAVAALGPIRAFGAAGPLSLPGGDLSAASGSAGGRFTTSTTGGAISVTFDRNGLGDGFAEGEAVTTAIGPTVTDGVSAVPARLRVTVRRAYAPPQLLGPIPDQVDLLS